MKILEIAKANKGKVALIGVGALALTAAAILAIKKMTGGSEPVVEPTEAPDAADADAGFADLNQAADD